MALLNKKIKAATLVETLVASVLIIVVFSIASIVLNQVVQSKAKANTHHIEQELNRLQYLYSHAQLPAYYKATQGNWTLSIQPVKTTEAASFLMEASHSKTGQKLQRTIAPL